MAAADNDDASGIPPVPSEDEFWNELGQILVAPCASYEVIDDALRSWLSLVSTCRDQYLVLEDDIATCSQQLLNSHIFCANKAYVRTQIVYSLLQEDEPGPLHIIANFLLLDGRSDEEVFKRMIDEGCFTRLVELVGARRDQDRRLHRLLLELMYEMSRIDRIRIEDLLHVDDNFVAYLFGLIESISDDVDDPYHYPIIRVLLVLNEQYMVTATTAASDPASPTEPLTNRVIKVLSVHGPIFRTFGENIILLLNRETETSLQLLILKLLYLLFTTKATYEYFYTNDLRVLLDVIIRNLLDLPNESAALRHTYLRVLYPLLAHTQLSHPPHYKHDEILKVLRILSGAGNAHFAPADETTKRLVDRVSKVRWLVEPGEGEMARKLLGISLSPSATVSKVSVFDVAAVKEKPGVQTPSRSAVNASVGQEHEDDESSDSGRSEGSPSSPTNGDQQQQQKQQKQPVRTKKVLPAVPRHKHGIGLKPAISINAISGTTPPKKLPPKAPPPRGSKLRQASSNVNLTKLEAGNSPLPAESVS